MVQFQQICARHKNRCDNTEILNKLLQVFDWNTGTHSNKLNKKT
jgi:hypothetical protein